MAEIVAGRPQLRADQERHIGDGLDRGAGVGAHNRYDAALIVSAGHTLVAVEYLEAPRRQQVERAVHALARGRHDIARTGPGRRTGALVESKAPAVEPASDALAPGNAFRFQPLLEQALGVHVRAVSEVPVHATRQTRTAWS
jgi:hypothetical protein